MTLSLAVTSALALLLALTLRANVPPAALAGWLLLLLAAAAVRITVHLRQRSAAAASPADPRWRRNYRLLLLLQGSAWALGGALMFMVEHNWQLDLLVFAIVGVAAGALLATAFDLAGALAYAAPITVPVLLLALREPPALWPPSLPIVLLLLPIAVVTMWRSHRTLREAITTQVALAQRADELRRAAELIDRTGRIAGIGGWEVEATTRRLSLSPHARRLLGMAAEVEAGAEPTLDQALAPASTELRAQLARALEAALAQGQPIALEATLQAEGGRERILRITGQARREGDRIVGVDGALQDVTRLHTIDRALADKHQLLEQLQRTARQGFWFIDLDGRCSDLNPAMATLLGRPRDEILGRQATDFFDGAARSTLQAELEARRLGRDGSYEIDLRRPDGSQRRGLVHASPLYDAAGRLTGSVSIWTDITRRHEAEQKLRASEVLVNTSAEYLRGTLEATGDAVFATDADHDDEPARFANEQLFRLWGLPEELRGRLTTTDLMQRMQQAFVDPAFEIARMEAIVDAGVPAHERLQLKDGRVLTLRFACATVNGRKLRVWSSRDITAETEAVAARETANAEQRSLLDNFPGYIAVIDENWHYQHINPLMATLVHQPPEQIIGRHVSEVMGELRWRKLRQLADEALRSGRAVSDNHYPDPDGSGHIDLQVTYVTGPPRAGGTGQLVYAFGIDITERKRAQAALIDALAEAERANKAKTQFLSSMSHELRTPLNAVLGFGQLLAKAPLPPAQAQHVEEILSGGRHLLGLINDLLDLGRIEAGLLQVDSEATDAESTLDDCVGLVRPLATAHGLSLHHERATGPAPGVWADPKRLRQVLLNLLSNAIKYNDRPGGSVRVEAVVEDGEVEFRVHDDGPGLSADEQQRLFRPFERLGAARGGPDGSGIGLSLSRSLVEAMGGRIGVRSEPGQGSTFWFRLRTAQPQAVPPAAAEPVALAARGLRALYIEDNPVNLMLMDAMLEDHLELVTEADPHRGLARAFEQRFDLVLLDIQLPGIDGYEVLRRLRADERTRALPVVAVSANAMRSDLVAGQAAGFDAYLTKPVDLDVLLATLQRVTGG